MVSAQDAVVDPSPAEKLILLDHDIRRLEYELLVARRRKRWGNILIVTGPLLLIALWIVSGFSQFDIRSANSQISAVVGLAGTAMLLKAVHYRLEPGGPRETRLRDAEKFFGTRKLEADLELELTLRRDKRKLAVSEGELSLKQRRLAYKAEAFSDVDRFRAENKRYRRIQNVLQGILIIGSLATTAIAGISLISPLAKWGTMATSFLVGIASGFIAAFKYRERGAYLQQTADAIESEWEAFDLGVGRYKHYGSDEDGQTNALADFAEEVYRLKTEQKKREQNLDQPPSDERSGPSAAS
ncbi:SLATT domain-containing protein [Amycolatopsis sp. lyj-109]|uniref:SLATT domain-containing protein n=1 Tax=Amycolatopsis sp. lyj-109 TaxID=2789287 RepID=UPI003979E0BA